MFVDEVDIHIAAGHGGRGAMSFRREKFVPRGGPNGGDGGPGGNVYLVANPNLNTLLNFRFQKEFEAGRGAHGEGANRTGRSGHDITLEVLAPYTVTTHIRDSAVWEHPRGAAAQWVAERFGLSERRVCQCRMVTEVQRRAAP